jgi:isocitrate/isopropylmalate dehydrogenase
MATKRVVALGGDGVGPEVVDATCYVLENAGFDLEILKPPCGEAAMERYKDAFPQETRQMCEKADAILFGATGITSIAIMAYIRWELDNYINVRPMKYYPGAKSCLRDPSGIDFVILRENSEGMYSFSEGDLSMLREKLPDFRNLLGRAIADYGEGKFAIRIVSEKGSRRLAEFACRYTRQRKKDGYPGRLTCVNKSNVLMQTDGLLESIVKEEAEKYPELSFNQYYTDDMARRLLIYPEEIFDVIVTTNMYGDILADEAAELIGGLGIAPSACLGGRVPYFESVHGSAPDFAGKNVINPTATILSAKLMLEYFDMHQEAEKLEGAVASVYARGECLTFDQGGKATTMEFADAVLREMI